MRIRRWLRVPSLVLVLLVAVVGGGHVPAHADDCEFRSEFAAIREAAGDDVIGGCVEAATTGGAGDVHQRTARGELVWRTLDRRAAFTDGSETWLVGPNGLRHRPNGERFFWEPTDDGTRDAPSSESTALRGAMLPHRRILSYYGNQLSRQMGILGEMSPDDLFKRLHEQAADYVAADRSHPVQLALELVAVVAQAGPGPDGKYRLRMDDEVIEEVAGWAESRGALLILDVQVGRSTVEEEVHALVPFLRRPYVHLAIDPEFAMSSSQVPGRSIGSHGAQDVNVVTHLLADLIEGEKLPPKVLIVHRFTDAMLDGHEKLETDPRVQVAVTMDGFGPPEVKLATWDRVIRGQGFPFNGFKLFYKQDLPLMTPEQVVNLDPSPLVVIYQ